MTDKERYKKLKEEGICVFCKKNPVESGYASCKACREKAKQRQQARREWLKEKGFCPNCGSEKLIGDEKVCLGCAAKKYESNRRYKKSYDSEKAKLRRLKRIEQHICTQCGIRKAESKKTMCRICLNKKNIYRQKHMTDIPRSERASYGRCYCCGEYIVDGKLCDKCRINKINNLPRFSEGWYQYHRRMNNSLWGNKVKGEVQK